MELTFTYKPELKLYIAEFRADKEFNIHIERPEPGYISMQQNSAEGGKYAAVDDWGTQNNDKLIIDYESGYFVTPKFIKIISKVLPTYAAITTDGDVVEIKSQAKVVEITSNGTTSVEPDAGFSYLSKVDVKVDVPTSGEGGGESGGGTGGAAPSGGIKVEYIKYDVNAGVMLNTFLIAMALSLRIKYTDETIAFGPKGFLDLMGGEHEVEAVMVSWDDVKAYGLGSQGTLREFLIGNGVSEEELNAIPRITEEEFYTL